MADRQLLQAWARICSFAWVQERNGCQVLENLRQDPKNTIIKIRNREYNTDSQTAEQAGVIVDFSDKNPDAPYSGYLPIPSAVGGLDKLSEKDLSILFQAGITGVLRFDDKAEQWAKIFQAAWEDAGLLKAIRQDPLANLPRVGGLNLEELQNSKYGILPIPDMPSSMSDDTIEKLENIAFNLDNLAGIIPLACL